MSLEDNAALAINAASAIAELKKCHALFPHRCCKFAARELHKKGYNIVSGIVTVDNYCGIGKVIELFHYWNYDGSAKLYVDITASQFNLHLIKEEFPEILIFEKANPPRCYTLLNEKIDPKLVK